MKRMIDSEVADRIKYTYDSENDESLIDIDTENLNVQRLSTASVHSSGSIIADGRMQCNTLSIKSSTAASIIDLYVDGNLKYLKGGQIANKQLYYHCIKLTSATKTAYVNIPSKYGTAVNQVIKFVSAIRGNLNALTTLDWYYGTDGHLIHAVYDDSVFGKVKVTIDDEPVTAYEGHITPIFLDNNVVL